MNKKAIALFCVFLTLLFTCAACKKRSPYGELVVDEQGMEHVIMTDANGVTVIDDNGNLIEVMTNSSNKKPVTLKADYDKKKDDMLKVYETHAVTFPGIVEKKETVEDAFCIVTLPEGWKQVGNNYLILCHVETDARIMIYTDIGGTLTGAVEKLNEDIAPFAEQDGMDQTDLSFDGITATRTEYRIGEMTQISYLLLTKHSKVCRINCTVETAKRDAVDIDAVVQSIHFK